MRPAEFSPEVIIEAGQQLQSAGRNVTGFALRKLVGGGNPSRLKQVWDEHIAGQDVIRAEPVAELPIELADELAAVSKALTERLAALAVDLNDRAIKAAERRVHEVVRTAGEQREQAERELADASLTVDELESKLEELKGDVLTLESELAEQHQKRHAQDVELAQLRERLVVMERNTEANETRHDQEAERLRAALAEDKHAALAAARERDQARDALAELKARFAALEQEKEVLGKAAKKEHNLDVERVAKAEADRLDASKTANAAREDLARLRGQLEATQAQNAQLAGLIAAAAKKGTAARKRPVSTKATGAKKSSQPALKKGDKS